MTSTMLTTSGSRSTRDPCTAYAGVRLRPSNDLAPSGDDVAIIERQDGHDATSGETFDLAAAPSLVKKPRQGLRSVTADYLRAITSCDESRQRGVSDRDAPSQWNG